MRHYGEIIGLYKDHGVIRSTGNRQYNFYKNTTQKFSFLRENDRVSFRLEHSSLKGLNGVRKNKAVNVMKIKQRSKK